MSLNKYFSNTYLGARDKFLTLAKEKFAQLHSIENIGIYGSEGEKLYTDFAYLGKANAEKIVIVSSGINGVEGFAGSAIQLRIMENNDFSNIDHGVLFIHCINPFGMSHYRKCNENNIDMNRNLRNGNELENEITNDVYDYLDKTLNPKKKPFSFNFSFYSKAILAKLKYTKEELKNGITCGQNKYKNSIFYSGIRREDKLMLYLRLNYHYAEEIDIIDIHTGTGDYGKDSVFSLNEDELFEDKYNDNLVYNLEGTLIKAIDNEFEDTKVRGFIHCFGTYPSDEVLFNLHVENYYTNNENIDVNHFSRQKLLRTYYPLDDEWKESVLEKGEDLYNRLVESGYDRDENNGNENSEDSSDNE